MAIEPINVRPVNNLVPLDCRKRTVPVYDLDGVFVRNDTPDAEYWWKVRVNGKTLNINGNHHLPCILGDPSGDTTPVATLTKSDTADLSKRYGPASVTKAQYLEWFSRGIVTEKV